MKPRLASSVQGQLNPDGSLFLAAGVSPSGFCKALGDRKIEAVLLPPFFNKGQLEFLISDEDLDPIRDLVSKWPGPHRVKLYSVTGGRREHRFEPLGTGSKSRRAVSFFPPHVAQLLIDCAHRDASGAKALDPASAFLACAYRAAYLQSECWDRSVFGWKATEDCEKQLRELAKQANLALAQPITPQILDKVLSNHGWRPSLDLLERSAHWMSWIREVLPDCAQADAPGATLFFLRARAVETGLQNKIIECLRDNGFEPLVVVELDEDQASKAALEFRGGNWGRGPYRLSGGPPATICLALDLLPRTLDVRGGGFADTDNERIVDAKNAARDLVNRGLKSTDHYNPVHSTDTSAQAWRGVELLLPGHERGLRLRAEQLRSEFASAGVVRDLTKHGRRAKVELVEFGGKLAVRKTFRPSALHFMEREIAVMQRLANRREIPRLLEQGPNYIVMEHVGGGATPPRKRRIQDPPRPLPLRHVRKLAEVITASMANGFDPIDLRADGNVIYTPSGLYLIDFEFWRACEPAAPEASMCLTGISPGDDGDVPRAGNRNRDPYRIGWYPYTLLTPESFLYDSAALQALKRSLNFARAYSAWTFRSSLALSKRAFRRSARKAMAIGVGLIGLFATRFLARQ